MSSVVGLTELLTINTDGAPVSRGNPLFVAPENILAKFRETFETFVPGEKWALTQDSGDIVQLDGNAAGASYLVISKDPLTVGGVTTLETVETFDFPLETAVGLSMSQRVLGQELAMELVSTEAPLPPSAELTIVSIQQSTTNLTVTTSAAHGLVAGTRIGIYGVTSDSRLNYPSLVVLGTNNTTQFVCSAGPAGTIPSLTVGPYTNQGFVYFRSALGFARNGVSEIFENASATNASFYVRGSGGDVLPSGTAGTNHSLTIATTTGTQAVSWAYNYAFLPSSEYRVIPQADRAQWQDMAVDTQNAPTTRLLRTQVVPDASKQYKLRFRFTNNKGLTVPTAKIVSAVKSGSTVATITTAAPHGLTTGDYVVVYGVRDQTNFANATTAGTISVINATTFQLGFGASATATSYGGMVARVQGQNVPAAFTTTVAQSAEITSAFGYGPELRLIGNANWVWLIGDYVNVYGVRDNTTGADLGVDGAYKVVEVTTTTLRLQPIGGTTMPASLALTNCGGTVIKRTDARLAFVRIFDYVRERVEMQATSAAAASVPAFITGGTINTVSGGAIGTQFFPNQITTDQTSAALTTTTTTATITPANNYASYEVNFIVTAVSGTGPTLDVTVQESDDNGTNWYDVYQFPRITATGQYRSPLIQFTGTRVRYVQTVGGTSPSFTRSINRIGSNSIVPVQRQFFSRIDLNTLNNVTSSFFTEGCTDLNVVVSMLGVTTTAPVLAYETSVEATGTAWAQVGTDITATANSTILLQLSNVQSRFSRIRVKTAGSGATVNYLMVKGVGK
jgi:hypothetical protein